MTTLLCYHINFISCQCLVITPAFVFLEAYPSVIVLFFNHSYTRHSISVIVDSTKFIINSSFQNGTTTYWSKTEQMDKAALHNRRRSRCSGEREGLIRNGWMMTFEASLQVLSDEQKEQASDAETMMFKMVQVVRREFFLTGPG